MGEIATGVSPFWHALTRFGEAQILLPAALMAMLRLLWQADGRRLAGWWCATLAGATLLTTATKVAFIGWGLGSPTLDFTGISGHAMFSAAVYPLLFGTLADALGRRAQFAAIAFGALLALGVAVSRVMVGVHSPSEAVAGALTGTLATAGALFAARLPRLRAGVLLPGLLALWLALVPQHAPPSATHAWVTRLALALSGHERPHTRAEWHHRAPGGAPSPRASPSR